MPLTKGLSASLLDRVAIASGGVALGAAKSVATAYGGTARIRLGRGTATAFTIGPTIRLEGSMVAVPTAQDWLTIAEFQMAVGTNIASQAFAGTEAVGQTVLTLAAGTNFATADYCFIENTTLGSCEWVRVVSLSGADVTVEEGLTIEQTAAASIMRDQAELYVVPMDLTSLQNIRLVVDAGGSGQEVYAQAEYALVTGL